MKSHPIFKDREDLIARLKTGETTCLDSEKLVEEEGAEPLKAGGKLSRLC